MKVKMHNYAVVSTGNSEADEQTIERFVFRNNRMKKNICPNGCGQMHWRDAYNRTCATCGFEGFSNVAFDMDAGTAYPSCRTRLTAPKCKR